ncbi:MAG: hypothetical protein ABI488_16615 [Polyangiaceae bacterium]
MACAWLLTALARPSCHDFHACYDARCEALAEESGGAPDAGEDANGGEIGLGEVDGAGTGEGGGAPGEGGAACVLPRADCDESGLTGCESNVMTDVRNCGACRANCIGACVKGSCKPFESLRLYMGLPAASGISQTSTELFALSNDYYDAVVRWSEQTGPVTLFEQGKTFQQLANATDRLYLNEQASNELWSLPIGGGLLQDEQQTARSIASAGGFLYAVDELGMPYRLSPATGKRLDLPLPSAIDPARRAVLATYDLDLTLLGSLDLGGYSVYFLSGSSETEWQLIATGRGQPVQARLNSDAVYLSVATDASGSSSDAASKAYELRQHSLNGATHVLARLTGVVDFELVGANVYVSMKRPDESSALRIISIADPTKTLEVETSTTMNSLTYVEPYFYFGETARTRLSRLKNWAVK